MPELIKARGLRDSADTALHKAINAMWDVQRPDGSWQGELAPSPVATGAVAIAMQLIDREGCAELIDRAVAWLQGTQRPDGGWGDTAAGPATLGGTAIAVAALRLIRPELPIDDGLAAMERLGGRPVLEDINRSPMYVVCQHYLSWAGLWPGRPAHRVPFEAVLLPRRLATKMSFALPTIAAFGIMQSRTGDPSLPRRCVDRAAERHALRRLAEIIEFEGPGGCFEESAFVAAVIAVGLHRAGLGDPIVARCMNYMRATVRADGSWSVDRDLEFSCTSYVVTGMQDAGLAGDARLRPAVTWITQGQHVRPFPMTGCPPGGWGWARPSAWPDTDDTALAVTALTGFGPGVADASVERGLAWLRAMQNRNGAWSCFVRNGRQGLDGSCSVLTAHALIALAAASGATPREPAVSRALRWLGAAQDADGSLSCLWFRGRTTPTARVLTALARLGLAGRPQAQRCAGWLISRQDPAGGWGDGAGGAPSAEETSWALIGLMSAGVAAGEEIDRAIGWLIRRQLDNGTWAPSEVGVYFPQLTYWCDHMANGHAIQALARYCSQSR